MQYVLVCGVVVDDVFVYFVGQYYDVGVVYDFGQCIEVGC